MRTIRSKNFEDVNVCVTLTSFDHMFAGLKLWDDAYAAQELGHIRVVNLSFLMRELQPWSVVRTYYNDSILEHTANMRENGFLKISWFEDTGFLARFADATSTYHNDMYCDHIDHNLDCQCACDK